MRRSVYSTLAGRKQGKRKSMNDVASSIQRLFRCFPYDVIDNFRSYFS